MKREAARKVQVWPVWQINRCNAGSLCPGVAGETVREKQIVSGRQVTMRRVGGSRVGRGPLTGPAASDRAGSRRKEPKTSGLGGLGSPQGHAGLEAPPPWAEVTCRSRKFLCVWFTIVFTLQGALGGSSFTKFSTSQLNLVFYLQ